MDAINIAIVEDEKVQAELLKKYVRTWSDANKIKTVIESFCSAESFEFKWCMDKKYSIVLLDIQMKKENGIELAKKIRKNDKDMSIIFITAMAEYIGAGYDVSALNYLIKPINENKLYECLDKAVLKIPKKESSILVETDDGILRIVQSDIKFVEAFSHYIEINAVQDKYIARKSISSLEDELDKNEFIRCHRSYIVGLKYIKKIEQSRLELDDGFIIPVSRRQYANTNKAFIKYFMGGANE